MLVSSRLTIQHRKSFQLDRTPKRTDFSLARVFLFFHRFCETHATLQTLQCFVIVCVVHNTLAHIYVQNILTRALATCGNSFKISKQVFCVIDILPVDSFPWKIVFVLCLISEHQSLILFLCAFLSRQSPFFVKIFNNFNSV